MRDWRSANIVAVLVLVSGCLGANRSVPVDPQASFAAHPEHARIVVDRASDGASGEIVPAAWRCAGRATFAFRVDGKTAAGLWVTAPATVEARRTSDLASESLGSVTPAWKDNAIRLELHTADGQTLQSDTFQRVGIGGSTVVRRTVQSFLDLRGTFRADLHDANGGTVGWLRTQIGPYNAAPRIYDAALPPALSPALAAAAVVALGSELDWIENHTLDVYRGGGSFEQSPPMNSH